MALALEWLPNALAAVLMLLLAGVLLGLNFFHRANRAFAFVLALRGVAILALSAPSLLGDPGFAEFGQRLFPYFAAPLGFAALYFAAVYPSPRRWLGGRRAWMLFLPAIAVVDLLYLLDHGVFATLPLGLLPAAYEPAYAFLGWVFARDAARAPPGPLKRSLRLVSLGFLLVPLFDVTTFLPFFDLPALVSPEGLALVLLPLAFAGAALVEVARAAAREPDRAERAGARHYLVLAGLAVASGVVVDLSAWAALDAAFGGVWRLPLPLLVTYALLRLQIFDIDLKVRWTIKQSTVAAAFIGVFFVVSEGAASLLSESMGPMLGIAAAGMLVFALHPLQRVAEMVARTALPDARAPGDLSEEERHRVYREQARAAWADGKLEPAERLLLDRLGDTLGLSADEARRLEREALQATPRAKV